ncbi:type III-A CRISPR-associated RAMP protein Csm5 [Hydrogenobacter thermophilus]|uniref:type III-A CRISPR-associated RAMP protein Csm5 n=1 Tax=Hydrogenobacter thermophilus TaxID=940 RepID=UPI0030F70D79
MKEFYEKVKVELEVLTPVHIGSGERLSKLEYIQEGRRLKVYPFDYLINLIISEPPSKRDNLLLIIKSGIKNLNTLFREYQLSYKPKYEIPLEGSLLTSQVELFIKNPSGPYIPGSELKGAIRTALLGTLLMQKEEVFENLRENLKKILSEADERKRKKRLREDADKMLEGFLRPEGLEKDARYDLLKALLLPDIKLSFEDLYGVEMKMVSSERHIFPCEALKPGTRAEFDMLLTVKTFETAKKITDTPPAQEKLRLKELRESVNNFYLQVIEQEIEYFKKKGMHKTVEAFERIKQKAGEGMLLRIGKHQGYISTTIMAVFRKKDRNLFERVFELSAPQVREEKPKTRRITFDGKPMGWILLKFAV